MRAALDQDQPAGRGATQVEIAGDQKNRAGKRLANNAQEGLVEAAIVEQQQLGLGQQGARHRATQRFGGRDFARAAGRQGR